MLQKPGTGNQKKKTKTNQHQKNQAPTKHNQTNPDTTT